MTFSSFFTFSRMWKYFWISSTAVRLLLSNVVHVEEHDEIRESCHLVYEIRWSCYLVYEIRGSCYLVLSYPELRFKVFYTRRPKASLLCPSVCLFIWMSVCLSVFLFDWMYVCLSKCLSHLRTADLKNRVSKLSSVECTSTLYVRVQY